ncbi:MAG: fused MFS/spermidine synthase, partial [Acidobacteria bacterium]|nr:fused MFS/spermidine synthase [Acidobacteriota bacterium]
MSHRDPAPRRLGAVALCLVLSGAGSLTLEVVWTRYLRLVFGSTTLAISTVLVAYMLGLGLGGLAGGRWARRFRDGVRTYALFEIGIGLYALAVPWILGLYPLLNRFLLADLTFWPAAFVRFFLVLVALLLPTVLMGATLPILVEALVRRSDQLARSVGLLYGVNTLGAVAGVLATTFVLFPALGVLWSNNVGASLDVLAGVLALVFLTRVAEPVAETATKTEPPRATGLRRWNPALLSYGLVGLTSLTYEVCWTRSLSMVFGSSTHAFAAMLAAFLVGIAMGSLIGRRWFDRLRNPLAAYGLGLALLGVLSLVTLLLLRQLTDVFLQLYLWLGITGKTVVAASFMISILAMIGPTLVLGALFPLLTRAIVGRDGSASAAVGDVYFINTLGSATGAFLAGFAAVPWLGLTGTMVFAIAVNLAAGMAILLWQPAWKGTQRNVTVGALAAMLVAIVAWQPAFDRARMTLGAYYRPEPAIEMGVPLQPLLGHPLREVVYYRDGVNATVSVDHEGGGYTLRINGKPDASLDDMPTQSLSGHIPMLFGAPADSALVIGYASGLTAGAVSLYRPSTLDLVELEPAVVEASHFFE